MLAQLDLAGRVQCRPDGSGGYRCNQLPQVTDLPSTVQSSLQAVGCTSLESLVGLREDCSPLRLSSLELRPGKEGEEASLRVLARYSDPARGRSTPLTCLVDLRRAAGKEATSARTVKLSVSNGSEFARLGQAHRELCARHGLELDPSTLAWLETLPGQAALDLDLDLSHSGRHSTVGVSTGLDGCLSRIKSASGGGSPDICTQSVELSCDRVSQLDERSEFAHCGAVDPGQYMRSVFEGGPLQPTDILIYSKSGLNSSHTEVGCHLHDRGGADVGQLSRVFDRTSNGESVVHHELFRLNPGQQGHALAKQVMARSIPFYQDQGFDQVEVHAGLSVGGYAWAKYGFVPTDSAEMGSLAVNLKNRLSQLPLEPEQRTAVQSLLQGSEPRSIWAVSDLQVPVQQEGRQTTLGKALLLRTNWDGRLDLRDSEALARFHAYVGLPG